MESIIYGKNRHYFGGIEPSNMINFIVRRRDGRVTLECQLPNDTVVDGQTLCTVAGAVIRRGNTGYPVDEFDGDLVMNITASGVFIDSDADINADYYYSAFPYTTQGVYNRNPVNRARHYKDKSYYLFGFDLDTTNADPATRVSYPSDVDNANFAPIRHVNFYDIDNCLYPTNNVGNYGDWDITPGKAFMPKPCMLTYDGVVDHYLDPNDYTKREDGVTASSVKDLTFNGNAMMEWPKIYTHRELVDGIYKFRCSDVPVDNDWDCWCNYDENNNQIDHFYTSIYMGHLHDNKLRSISGKAITVGTACTTSSQLENAANNGDGWYIETVSDRLLIQDLLVLMAKHTNLQLIYGEGRCSGNGFGMSGMHDKHGLFTGYSAPLGQDASGGWGSKTFGMEHWWGNYNRRLAGWIFSDNHHWLKITPGTHDGTTVTGFNVTRSGYLRTESDVSNGINGYIKTMEVTPYGRIPVDDGGANTTYETDYCTANSSGGPYAATVGGYFGSGVYPAGPFYTYLQLQGTAGDTNTGAAISCKPLAKEEA